MPGLLLGSACEQSVLSNDDVKDVKIVTTRTAQVHPHDEYGEEKKQTCLGQEINVRRERFYPEALWLPEDDKSVDDGVYEDAATRIGLFEQNFN